MVTKLVTVSTSFRKQTIASVEKELTALLDEYGFGWELYIKCDSNGNLRLCPKGEIYVKNE